MLYIIATPIGNLDDITPRALHALRQADVLACEDTRRTRILLSHFQIPSPPIVLSYREGVEERVGEKVVRLLQGGSTVALCSDGGYPGISDPGYRLARMVVKAGLEFHVLPGASAVHVALVSAGLPTSSYTFKGYPPRKPGALRRFFEDEKDRPHTLVLFESPFRVAKTLAAAREVLGNREAAVCIELTKKFERVLRGPLEELLQGVVGKPIKGEVTIVVAGCNPKFEAASGEDDKEPAEDSSLPSSVVPILSCDR
jgi:16S rRNA (cytidine1402-2'-O)-methyltransferase